MILVPEVGKPPQRSASVFGGRLLHVCLRSSQEKQPALAAALKSISSDYAELDWQKCGATIAGDLVEKVKAFMPDLIWMQLQCRTNIDADVIAMIRGIVPSCKIVQWDGDQHFEPHSSQRHWFVELGREIDCSLVVNTAHPAIYADLGVVSPGYLQIGVDGDIYRPCKPASGVKPIVMLASHYGTHERRNALVHDLLKRDDFAVYGHGWNQRQSGFLRQEQEAPVYSAAKCAISMSIRNDLPRYTSDRLFRAMGSGAVVLVERFPDMEGLGLEDAGNCAVFDDARVLDVIADQPERFFDTWQHMRTAAAALVAERHTWKARMPELCWILEQL